MLYLDLVYKENYCVLSIQINKKLNIFQEINHKRC